MYTIIILLLFALTTGLVQTDIRIEIVRQREVAIVDLQTAFMVDCIVTVGGEPLFPQVFPALPADDIIAALPAPPAGNAAS